MQVFFQWSMVQAMWSVGYKLYPLTISWRCFILTLTSKDCFKVKQEKKKTPYVTGVTFRVENYIALYL